MLYFVLEKFVRGQFIQLQFVVSTCNLLLIERYGRFASWFTIERWILQRWGCSERKAWIYEKISLGSARICYQAPKRTRLSSQIHCFVQWCAKEKQAFDEALSMHGALGCVHKAIPRNRPYYHEVKLEAETTRVDLEMKKAEYDQKFATYAQHCTDVQGSASQIRGHASGASR